MIKRFLLIFLMLVATVAEGNNFLFSEKSFIAVVRNTQGGIYYGDPVIRELVDRGLYSGVYVLYLDPSSANTRTERKHSYQRIAEKLNSIKPLTIYISKDDTELIDYLHDSVKPSVSVVKTSKSGRAKRHAEKIMRFLLRSDIDIKTLYILQDKSTYSEETSILLKTALEAWKSIPNLKVKILTIPSFQGIRLKLNVLNSEEEVVIINNLQSLLDVELSIYKGVDDIKQELIKYNAKHLDIGFYRALENEAIVIEDYPIDIHNLIVNGYGYNYIRVGLYVNPERIRKLKYNNVITNYFYQIDGLIE